MITRIIIKLSEGDTSRSLLKKLVRETIVFGYDYNILRRPPRAYEKDSFDGLLEIECHDQFDSFNRKLIKLIHDLKASVKTLVINPNEVPCVLCYVEGEVTDSIIDFITDEHSSNQLMNECLYYGENLSFNFKDNPLFIQSKDYLDIFEILYKYSFTHLEFNSHIVSFKPWFFLPRVRAEVFINDFKYIAKLLYKHNIYFDVDLIGYDSQLNLQSINIGYEKKNMAL